MYLSYHTQHLKELNWCFQELKDSIFDYLKLPFNSMSRLQELPRRLLPQNVAFNGAPRADSDQKGRIRLPVSELQIARRGIKASIFGAEETDKECTCEMLN